MNEQSEVSGQLGPVEICIPPDPRLARIVRLAASSMAAQIGFDVDLIDDVKLVVSEILLALVELGDGDNVRITLTADQAQITASGTTVAQSFEPADSRVRLSLQVLEGVASHHQFAFADGQIQLSAVVRDIVV